MSLVLKKNWKFGKGSGEFLLYVYHIFKIATIWIIMVTNYLFRLVLNTVSVR